MDISVIKNKDYEVMIDGMTHEAQGVGRIDGLAVFVDGVIKGEVLKIKIIKVAKNYAIGKLLEIITESPDRIEPFCRVYKRCGGCSLQHMTYEKQLEFKEDTVKNALERIGGFEVCKNDKLSSIKLNKIVGMHNPFNYRNKAQFPVGIKDGIPQVGFYAMRSHEIIDNPECGIQDEINFKVVKVVKEYMKEFEVSAYNEETGKGIIRHIVTKKGFKTGEVMVVIVVTSDKLPNVNRLIDRLNEDIEGFQSVFLNINSEKSNVVMGRKNILLHGKETISDFIGKFKFEISPNSFFQVNPVQTEVLYGKALEFAGLTGNETVMDIYCGIGTISLFLADKAKKVIGVEVVEQAVEDAKRNAAVNGVENVEFFAGEAEKVIPELYAKGVRADVVVLDPPRKGCEESVLQTIVDMGAERVVYVSCNPATLARDLRWMAERGYVVSEVQPVDMFPWTWHTESVCLLQMKSDKL